jgi:hypothetical protein
MRRDPLLPLLLLAASSCGPGESAPPAQGRARVSSDSAFALVQTRGQAAMGVDQYTSTHRFESLPDGGRISLERNSADSAGAARIRGHLQTIALAFARGEFAVPGFVHDREVPGSAVMSQRRSRISYTVDTLPRGGQLRIRSADPAAVAAIHEFLAFQRRDHRAGAGPESH